MTLGLDPTQIRVAGAGAIWKAPFGTTAPADSTTAWGAGWVNLGYAEDGFTITPDFKTQEITGWQTLDVLRLITTKNAKKLSWSSLQSSNNNVALAWGGATITPTTGGVYTMDIPDGQLTDFALGVDWSDGITSQRFLLQRAALVTIPTIKFTRTDAVKYPLEVQALKPANGTKSILVYGVDSAVATVS